MAKRIDVVPKEMSVAEASEFWDTHSVADYPSRVVRMKYVPDENLAFVAIANDLLRKLEKRAKKQGISVETLINLWIQEKLSA